MPLVWENGPKFEYYTRYYYCRVDPKRLLVVKTRHGSVTCYHCWARDDDSPAFTPEVLQFWFRSKTLACAFEEAEKRWSCLQREEQKLRAMGSLLDWYCIGPNNYASCPSTGITLRIGNVESSDHAQPGWRLYQLQGINITRSFWGSLEEALRVGDEWFKELSPVKYLGQRLGMDNG